MNRIEIYSDDFCNITSGSILEEGRTYYIKVNFDSENERKRIIIENNLDRFVDIQPQNKIGKLKVDKKVGFIRIDGKVYDIRSKLLLPEFSGQEQVDSILNDIRKISKGLLFKYSGITHLSSTVDREDKSPTLFERFNYYRQLVLEMQQGRNLSSLIEIVLRNPKRRIVELHELVNINNLKNNRPKKVERIINAKQFIPIPPKSPLSSTALGRLVKESSGKDIFPYQFYSDKIEFSFDNQENRFVKYFLQDINLTANFVLSKKTQNLFITESANKMIDITDRFLTNPFFIRIGKIQTIPSSSTVLLGRSGYREIYQHFINSRFGLRNLLDVFDSNNIHTTLKDISELYEIWAFYKIGSILFKDEITISKGDRLFKEGNVSFGYCWEDKNYKLYYNYSYTRKSGNSYSLSLRPDFTVCKKSTENEDLYLLDTKYKGREIYSDDTDFDSELIKYFNSEDIHKMHCYLDAIKNSRIAVILYPGDVFRFFEKDYNYQESKNSVKEIKKLHGVGAVPLNPYKQNQEMTDLIEFIQHNDMGL